MGFFSREPKLYVGWLFGNESERQVLVSLGVKGPMRWKPDRGDLAIALGVTGIFECCFCDKRTMKKLENEYNVWWHLNYPNPDLVRGYVYPTLSFSWVTESKAQESCECEV